MTRDAAVGAEWRGPAPVVAFAARMRVLHAASGRPSLQVLEELMNRVPAQVESGRQRAKRYPTSTIHDKLMGRSKPTAEFVKAFVLACAAYSGAELDIVAWGAEYLDMLAELGRFKADRRAAETSIEQYPGGITIEWTSEGPKVGGNRVLLSPTEVTALLDRWMDSIAKFVEQEHNRRNDDRSFHAGRVLTAIHVCGDTYIRVPDEDEIRQLATELARKYNLFYQFIELLHVRIGARYSTFEVETLFQACVGDSDGEKSRS